ncbi:hypothetical protein ACWEXP_07830 [Staphylococcus pseudoxylosus]
MSNIDNVLEIKDISMKNALTTMILLLRQERKILFYWILSELNEPVNLLC